MTENAIGGVEQKVIEQLAGTVKLYQRHPFVCTGRADWPALIEDHLAGSRYAA